MANIFNDLNKLVNTVQKVDKLLSDKPKQSRFTKSFSLDEVNYLFELLRNQDDQMGKKLAIKFK